MDDPNLDEPVLSNLLFADHSRRTLFRTTTRLLLHSLKRIHQRPRFQSQRLVRPLNRSRYIIRSPKWRRRFWTTINRRLVRGMRWESFSGALERKDCVFSAKSGERTPHSTLMRMSLSTANGVLRSTNRSASRKCCTTKRRQNQIWILISQI